MKQRDRADLMQWFAKSLAVPSADPAFVLIVMLDTAQYRIMDLDSFEVDRICVQLLKAAGVGDIERMAGKYLGKVNIIYADFTGAQDRMYGVERFLLFCERYLANEELRT